MLGDRRVAPCPTPRHGTVFGPHPGSAPRARAGRLRRRRPRPACGSSSASTRPRSARRWAAPGSTRTPGRPRAGRRARAVPGDGVQERARRAGPRRRQGGDHRRPGGRQDRGAAAGLRPVPRRARRPLRHGLRRRHLRGRHGRGGAGDPVRDRPLPGGNGGAGDSSVLTAYGVFQGMRAGAEHLWGSPTSAGRTVGIAGVGKVGRHLVGHLVDDGATVVVTDVSSGRGRRRTAGAPGRSRSVDDTDALVARRPGRLLAVRARPRADRRGRRGAVAPGWSAAGPTTSWPTRASRTLLAERGILYAPDYCVNAGGVIQVADELRGLLVRAGQGQGRRDLRHHARGCSRPPPTRASRPRWPPTGSPSGGWPTGPGAVGAVPARAV